MLSPRALVRGIPARAKFAAENSLQVANFESDITKKSIRSFLYMQVMCHWSLNLIFRAKLKLESRNRKSNIASRWQILKVTSLKINRPLPIATNNMYMKFQFQSKLAKLRSGNHVTYRRTDRLTDKVNPVYPPTNFVGREYNDSQH